MAAPLAAPASERSDIVDRFIELLREWSPQTAATLGDKGLRDLDSMLRREFGGDEVYVARGSRAVRRDLLARVEAALRARENPRAIARRLGIGRATVYRMKQELELRVSQVPPAHETAKPAQ